MTEEIWKPILGFDDYEVSNQGRVRSNKRSTPHILKPSPQRSGHLQLWLRKDGKTHAVRVHRLVLEAFAGECPDGCVGTHKDNDPTNNHIDNLLWDTQSNNILHMIASGRRTQPSPKPRFGEDHPQHKLTATQVLAIRNDNRSCSAIAKEYGVSKMTIHRCKTKQSYSNV